MHVGGRMRCIGSGGLSSAGLALLFFHLVLAIFEGDQRSRQLHIQHTAFSEELSVLMSAARMGVAALLLRLGAKRGVVELMSADDHQAYQAAFAAARARAWSAMKRSAAAATERAPAKILLWLELTRGNLARFADIADFIDHNPEWPAQDVLRHRAEEAMEDVPDAVLQPYFQKHRPVTTMGKLRLAGIFTAAGQAGSAARPRPHLFRSGAVGPTRGDSPPDVYPGASAPED